MTAALAGETIHLGHVVLLASLLGKNDQTQTELTQTSGIEKSSVVLFLDFLEKDGWLERRRHPTDRRAHHVHLPTPVANASSASARNWKRRKPKRWLSFHRPNRQNSNSFLTKLIASLDS